MINRITESGWPKFSHQRRAVYEYCVSALLKRQNPPTMVSVERLRKYVSGVNPDNKTKARVQDKPGPAPRSSVESTYRIAQAVQQYAEKHGIQPTVNCVETGVEVQSHVLAHEDGKTAPPMSDFAKRSAMKKTNMLMSTVKRPDDTNTEPRRKAQEIYNVIASQVGRYVARCRLRKGLTDDQAQSNPIQPSNWANIDTLKFAVVDGITAQFNEVVQLYINRHKVANAQSLRNRHLPASIACDSLIWESTTWQICHTVKLGGQDAWRQGTNDWYCSDEGELIKLPQAVPVKRKAITYVAAPLPGATMKDLHKQTNWYIRSVK